MKFYLLMIIIFLTACSKNMISSDFNFSDDMSFDEFKIKLEEYSKNSPYPKIDD